jgi:hypothetical protein
MSAPLYIKTSGPCSKKKTSGLLKAQLVQKREKNRGGKDGMRRLIN